MILGGFGAFGVGVGVGGVLIAGLVVVDFAGVVPCSARRR